jgi:hypothetical protein
MFEAEGAKCTHGCHPERPSLQGSRYALGAKDLVMRMYSRLSVSFALASPELNAP